MAACSGPMVSGDPCDRGTSFTALKVVRAYRDNEAFAFKHLEGKQLEISGRLIAVKRDKIIVNDVLVFDGYVALVTPDGKPPKPVGLEFRFSVAALKADPQLARRRGGSLAGPIRHPPRQLCSGAYPKATTSASFLATPKSPSRNQAEYWSRAATTRWLDSGTAANCRGRFRVLCGSG